MGVNGTLLNSAFTAAIDLIDGQIGRIKEDTDEFDVQGYLNTIKIKND